MKRREFIWLSAFALLFEGCAYRECSEDDRYKGLWNAMTCKYDERISKLKSILSEEKAKELKLFNAYQRLIAEVNKRKEEIKEYENSISLIDNEIIELRDLLVQEEEIVLPHVERREKKERKKIAQKRTKKRKEKIKKHLTKIKKSLKVKKTKFKKADIKLTKAYLDKKADIKLSEKYENSSDIKLAKAFVDDSKKSKLKLTKAYDKGYALDNEIRLSLHNNIDKMIMEIDRGDNFDDKKEKKLLAELKLTEKYVESVL